MNDDSFEKEICTAIGVVVWAFILLHSQKATVE